MSMRTINYNGYLVRCRGRLTMTKRPFRHIVGTIMFAAIIGVVAISAMMEIDGPYAITAIAVVCIGAIVLVYGVEMEEVRVGKSGLYVSFSDPSEEGGGEGDGMGGAPIVEFEGDDSDGE